VGERSARSEWKSPGPARARLPWNCAQNEGIPHGRHVVARGMRWHIDNACALKRGWRLRHECARRGGRESACLHGVEAEGFSSRLIIAEE